MIDVVVPIGQVILTATLIPTLWNRVKLPAVTTIPAFLVLSAFAATFAQAGLPFSAGTSAASAGIWLCIFLFGKAPRLAAEAN